MHVNISFFAFNIKFGILYINDSIINNVYGFYIYIKRVHSMPVLHFLFLVLQLYNGVSSSAFETVNCGRPRWSPACFAPKREYDAMWIQNGVSVIIRGNGIRLQRRRQSGGLFHCRSISVPSVHTLKPKAARKPLEWVGGVD